MFGLNDQELTVALRWYSTIVDCLDVSAQANWWAAALGWKKAYEADDEVVLVPQHATLELLQSAALGAGAAGVGVCAGPRG